MKSLFFVIVFLYAAFSLPTLAYADLGSLDNNDSSSAPAKAEKAKAPKAKAKSMVGRQGEFFFVQLVTPDWELLPLERKMFAYNMAMAMEAGRDILWRQLSKNGLAIRQLLEDLYAFANLYDPVDRAQLEKYTFEIHLAHSNFDHWSRQKFVPDFSYEDLKRMAEIAQLAYSSRYPRRAAKDWPQQVDRLRAEIFDPNFKKYLVAPDSEGLDPVLDSSGNMYGEGVTKAMVDALPKSRRDHILSYPHLTDDGEMKVDIARIGGRFDVELRMVDHYLAEALKYANASERKVIEAERKLLRSGSKKDYRAADIAWVKHVGEDVDFKVGFVETYDDPLGVRASWEGEIHLPKQDAVTKARVKAIRDNADYFEAQMPVKPEYKKPKGFEPPKAEATYFLSMGGELAERGVGGINLPNDSEIRRIHGSKSVTAYNIMNSIGGDGKINQRALDRNYLQKYHALARRVNQDAVDAVIADMKVEFHEVLGHGSGQLLPGIQEEALEGYYAPLEEMRAETAALYHFTDHLSNPEKLREIGVLPSDLTDEQVDDWARFAILSFFTGQIWSYTGLPEDQVKIGQAHQWARQTMLNWLIKDGVITVNVDDAGIARIDLEENLNEARASLGQLWDLIQDIKGRGAKGEAQALFDEHGGYSDENREWRAAMKEAKSKDNVPSKRMMLNPRFVAVDSAGKEVAPDSDRVADVRIKYYRANHPQPMRMAIQRQMQTTRSNAKLRRQILSGDCKATLRKGKKK